MRSPLNISVINHISQLILYSNSVATVAVGLLANISDRYRLRTSPAN